jgi:3',5'-cyclic-nucleotide phosphodiesterase
VRASFFASVFPALLAMICASSGAIAAERPPAFELRPLGVLGGDADDNLSCYLLGRPGEPSRIMIDAGTIRRGLILSREKDGTLPPGASNAAQSEAVRQTLSGLEALLVTHSHLDHIAGLLLISPMLLGAPPRTPFRLVALPETLEAIAQHLFKPPVWLDLPILAPVFRPERLPPGQKLKTGTFEIETELLRHPVPSAAFFITAGEATYLHLGDTGPTEAVWERARPLLRSRSLRAVAVEVSYPSSLSALGLQNGHLTPRMLVVELDRLAHLDASPPDAAKLTADDAVKLAARLAPVLRDVSIIAIHIKASGYDTVVTELRDLQQAGLHIIIPSQGDRIRF